MNITPNYQSIINSEIINKQTNPSFLGMHQFLAEKNRVISKNNKYIMHKIKDANPAMRKSISSLAIPAGTILAIQNGKKTEKQDIKFTKQQIEEIFGNKDVFKLEVSSDSGRYWIHLFEHNDLELCVIRGDENSGVVDGVAYVPYSRNGYESLTSPKEPFISAITKNLSKDKQNLFFNSKLFDITRPKKDETKKEEQRVKETKRVEYRRGAKSDDYGLSYEERKRKFQKAGIPNNVLASLERQKARLKQMRWVSENNLEDYQLDRLEGIQKGTIFEHLTLSQIALFIRKWDTIAIQNGCDNNCIYCYVEAKPSYYYKTHNFVNKIDFDDYDNLINNMKELNERFGLNIFNPPGSWGRYHTLFHNSDCSQTCLEKDGIIYDYADLAKMLNNVTGRAALFDTAGWNINDNKTQKRMENLVQKVMNNKEFRFIDYNISINPFNGIYNRAVELKQKGDVANYQRLREIYTDRMANTIFTLSPLMERNDYYYGRSPQPRFIIRALSDDTELVDYNETAVKGLFEDIVKKLDVLYEKDLNSDSPKVIKNTAQKEKYLKYLNEYIKSGIETKLVLTNKRILSKFISKSDLEKHYSYTEEKLNETLDKMKKTMAGGIIDVDGSFYITNDAKTYRTNIFFNHYTNKGKPTAPIKPNLMSEIITI